MIDSYKGVPEDTEDGQLSEPIPLEIEAPPLRVEEDQSNIGLVVPLLAATITVALAVICTIENGV